jgi:hypothetical protein
MLLKFLRKSKRVTSSFLVLNLVIEIAYPLKAFSSNFNIATSGSGSPISASVSSMVDGYTGDFRYSVPLLNLPGPNGENVPISVNYNAGIGVNQNASWVGLGWDYNPGEITRQIIDVPDDYNGLLTFENQVGIANYGSLYYNNLSNTNVTTPNVIFKSTDIKTVFRTISDDDRDGIINQIENTYDYHYVQEGNKWERNLNINYRFRKHMSPHKSLAYDNYSVSGGISGNLKLFALGQTKLFTGKYNKNAVGLNSANNRKPNFYFEGSSLNNIDLQNYSNSSIVNQSTNQIHSGTYVRYFTNAEINNNSNLYNNATGVGFLDYKATTNSGYSILRRTENPDLIGAFQITDNSGVTYHYALPEYSFKNLNYNWTIGSNADNYCMKFDKYASSWKLTAITGQDYQDSNNNYTVDEGDTGYWVAYNYSLWSSDYMWSSKQFGYFTDNSISLAFSYFVATGLQCNQYNRSGSILNGHNEKYYLNYIKTASHTAFFVKSIRKDAYSYNPDPLDFNFIPTPLLKLDKVVLMNNDDKSYLINNTSLSTSDKDSRFSYASCGNALSDMNFVNKSRFDINEINIKAKALKIVELESDYCLAKKYSTNINNSFNNTSISKVGFADNYTPNSNQVRVYSKTFQSSSDLGNSGKLTLKKIKFYDLLGAKITPSIDFGYDENNIAKNPDFNGDKTDWWGYYKKDYEGSNFVTAISKDDVDAWSLKQINTSLGGQINVQYESDIYHKEGFYGDPSFKPLPCFISDNWYRPATQTTPISLNKPHRIFPMQNVNYTNGDNISSFTLWDNDTPNDPVGKTFIMYNFESTFYSASTGYLKQLVRKGNESGNPQIYGASSFSDFQEKDVLEATHGGGQVSGATFDSNLKNGVGIHYKLCFSSSLYGGGVRVKQIDVVDPFKNDVYTQKFSYGNGYCAVVPKTIELASANGPSAYDLVMSTKSLVNSSANSRVGYDSMTQTSFNQDGSSNGSIVQTYYNSPIQVYGPVGFGGQISDWHDYEPQCSPTYVSGCNVPGFNPNNVLRFYTFTLNLSTTDLTGKQLGLLLNSSVLNSNNIEIFKTQYQYGSKSITEKFLIDEMIQDDFIYKRLWILPDNLKSINCKEKGYTVKSRDFYRYNFSLVHNNSIYLKGSTSTKDGITISENIVSRDPYTMAPTLVVVNDPTQGVFEKYTSYAYSNSAVYPSFGLKTMNETNRNLLGLTYSSTTLKNIQNTKYVISQSHVTYTNNYPTRLYSPTLNKYISTSITHPWYRLNETYVRKLDDDVLATVVAQPSDYRKTSTGTLYDSENNRIEEEGLNQRKSASKWGYSNHYKLADISNANYNSFTFTSFEDKLNHSGVIHFGGEVDKGHLRLSASSVSLNGNLTIVKPHTGNYLAVVPNNDIGPEFNTENFDVGRTYIAKVWVHKTSSANASLSIDLNGSSNISKTVFKSDASNIVVGDWVLMSLEIDVPQNFNLSQAHSLKVTTANFNGGSQSYSNAYFDDLSFHPKDAVITGNVYNEQNGLLIAQLDNENFATLYNYDEGGRIISTYKEYSGGIKKVTESQYHFFKP